MGGTFEHTDAGRRRRHRFTMTVNVITHYLKVRYILRALRNPRIAFESLKEFFTGFANIEASLGIELGKYIDEINSKIEFNRHIWCRINQYESSLKSIAPVEKDIAMLLYALVRALKPVVVVETGVGAGVSSAYILQALEDNQKGKLFSIDLPTVDKGPIMESGWVIPDGLKHRWWLELGKSSERLRPMLEKLEVIDIFFHDSEHSYLNMKWEFETVWPYLRKGGILISDNINFNNAFSEFNKTVKAKFAVYGQRLGLIIKD